MLLKRILLSIALFMVGILGIMTIYFFGRITFLTVQEVIQRKNSTISTTPEELEKLFLENEKEFTTIAEKFYQQNNILEFTIYPDEREILNSWSNWDVQNKRKVWNKAQWKPADNPAYHPIDLGSIYLDNIDQVLTAEGITREDYQYYKKFILKYKEIWQIIKKNDGVEFNYYGAALRYFSEENNDLEITSNVQFSKRINKHWFVYKRWEAGVF